MSNEKLMEYRSGRQPIPKTMLRWHLYGAGFENLGKDGKPETVDVPHPGADELLVRQDACGLCFSDTKVINLGEKHPRMTNRHLAEDPVTLGHEVSVTVVEVGASLTDKFQVGDRFVVQADVFFQGVSMAYGYAIKGGLAEYSVIPHSMISGDEGCYLLPLKESTGYTESALTEPWACVVSAYVQSHRDGIKAGGLMLVVGDDEAAEAVYDWQNLFSAERKPARIFTINLTGAAFDSLTQAIAELNVPMEELNSHEWDHLRVHKTDGHGFDDIVILGAIASEAAENIAGLLADHGIMNLVCDRPFERSLSMDVGRVHYNWHHFIGTSTNRPADSYREMRTSDLLPGGSAWMIGAGGPMGQMHVQRAVQSKGPPRRVVATDVDTARLQSVMDRFGPMARDRGIELVILNPKELGDEAFHRELRRLTGNKGFDDIVCMVPVPAVMEDASGFLAMGGWFNVFAGVARGTMAALDVNRIVSDRTRFIGSSGSSLSDMRTTLSRVETKELSTNSSLAAIGGMDAVAEGLKAVKEGWFPGKTLVFPLIHHLPLTPLSKLEEKYPTVYAKLRDGQFWTTEAEEELLSLLLVERTEA